MIGSSLNKGTIMSNEVFMLFQNVSDIQSALRDYKTAILEGNYLGKRTVKSGVLQEKIKRGAVIL